MEKIGFLGMEGIGFVEGWEGGGNTLLFNFKVTLMNSCHFLDEWRSGF